MTPPAALTLRSGATGLVLAATLVAPAGAVREAAGPTRERDGAPRETAAPDPEAGAVPLALLDFLLRTEHQGEVLDALIDSVEADGRLPPMPEEEPR